MLLLTGEDARHPTTSVSFVDGRGRPSLQKLVPNIAACPKADNIFLSGKACTIRFLYQPNPKVPFDRITGRPKNESGATGGSSGFRQIGCPERPFKAGPGETDGYDFEHWCGDQRISSNYDAVGIRWWA